MSRPRDSMALAWYRGISSTLSKVDQKFLVEDNVKFIIQFNGKTRKIMVAEKDTTESFLINKIKEKKKLNKYLKNKNIKKKIFIPNKLINIIIN